MNLLSYRRSLLQDEDADIDREIRSPAPSFTSASPFDSSLILTILIVLTALFFMAFFSLYFRRFSNSDDSSVSAPSNSPSRFHTCKRDGVDAATVQSLPNILYGGDSKIWSECSICLSEFEEREAVTVIPYCRHGFHPSCIEKWLLSHVSCPLCRSTQLFPVADEVRGYQDV